MLFLLEWLMFAAVTAQEFSVDLKALYDNQESMTTKSWKTFYSEPPQALATDAETDSHVYKDVSQESAKTEHNSDNSDGFGLFRHYDEPKILPDNELLLADTLPADEDLDTKDARSLGVSRDNLFKMISTPLPVGPGILEVLTKPMKCIKPRQADEEESGEQIMNFIKSINQNPKGDAYDVFLSSFLSTRNMEPVPKQYQYNANEYGYSYSRKYQGLSIPNKPILVKRPTIKIKKFDPERFNENPDGDAYAFFFSPAPKQYRYHYENEYGNGRKYKGALILPTLVQRLTMKVTKEYSRNIINDKPEKYANEASFSYLPARTNEDVAMQHDENEGYGERHQIVTVIPLLQPRATVPFKQYQGVTIMPTLTQLPTFAVIKQYFTNTETVNYGTVLKFLSTLIMNNTVVYFYEESKTTSKSVYKGEKNETVENKDVVALQVPAEIRRDQNMLDSLEALMKNKFLALEPMRVKAKAPHNNKQEKTRKKQLNKKKKMGKSKKTLSTNKRRLTKIVRYNIVKAKPNKQINRSKPRNDKMALEQNVSTVYVKKILKNKNIEGETKQPPPDLPALMDILDNLTVNWSADLVEKLNESIIQQLHPTCATTNESVIQQLHPTCITTNTSDKVSTSDEDSPYGNVTGVVMGKCFVCGMDAPGMPFDTDCADAFSSDPLIMVPINRLASSKIGSYRKNCRWKNIPGYEAQATQRREVWGRWTGGCSVRWIDISGIYTQRTCRNKYVPAMGKHWASKRMAKLELTLKGVNNGCIVSPVASLVPMSRSISLYARFHACVCSGDWCNQASVYCQWSSSIVMISISTTMSWSKCCTIIL